MWTIWCFISTQKYTEDQAITPAYGMISPGSDASHRLELFKMGSVRTLEKFILRMLFPWNDIQLFIQEKPKHNSGTSATLPWQLLHCKQIYSHNAKRVISALYLQWAFIYRLTFSRFSFLTGMRSYKMSSSTHFCWKIIKCYFNFLSFLYLLAKVPYIIKQCFLIRLRALRSFYEESKTVVSFWKWHFVQTSFTLWVPAFPVVSSCSGQLWHGVIMYFPFFRFCKLWQSCLCTGCHSVNERLSDWHEASESTA